MLIVALILGIEVIRVGLVVSGLKKLNVNLSHPHKCIQDPNLIDAKYDSSYGPIVYENAPLIYILRHTEVCFFHGDKKYRLLQCPIMVAGRRPV